MVILELRQKATMADFFIKNFNDLDENAIQELIEFAEIRGGFFREDLKRFSIRKRASIEYLEEIYPESLTCIVLQSYKVQALNTP